MHHLLKTAVPFFGVLALGLLATPALADITSASRGSFYSSVGSSRSNLDDIEESSDSSSTKGKVAQGPYTVVEMVALAQQPDMLRLRLQPVAQAPGTGTANTIVLLLPRQAVERGQLAVGQVVAAEHRPYGVAFATITTAGDAATPFFLVLDDAWFGELQSRPLGV
jgi:hypothetical protein